MTSVSDPEHEVAPGGMSRTSRERVLSNSLYGLLTYVVFMPVVFLLNAFAVHRLGLSGYGVWIGVLTVIGYGSLLDLGMSVSVSKFVAENLANGRTAEVNTLLNTAIVFYMVIGGIFAAGMALASGWIGTHVIHIPTGDTGLWVAFILLLATFPVRLAGSALISLIDGLQRADINSWLVLAYGLLAAGATVVVLLAGMGVTGLVLVTIGSAVGNTFATWLVARILFAPLAVHPRHFRWASFKLLLRFSTKVQVGTITATLSDQVDRTLIAFVFGPALLGSFGLAAGAATALRGVSGAFMHGIVPAASDMATLQQGDKLRRLYIRSTRYLTIVDFALVVGTVVLARPLVYAWLGSGHDRVAVTLVVILLPYLVRLPAQACSEILYGVGRPEIRMRADTAFLLIHIPLSMLLLWRLGYYGAVLGTGLATVSTRLYLYGAGSRALGVTVPDLLKASLLQPAIGATLAAAPVIALQIAGAPLTIPMLALESTLFVLIFGFYVVTFALDAYDRRLHEHVLSSVWDGARRLRTRTGQ